MSYLDELNKAQRDAVEYIDGPALVIAGAGSGKTRVLTYKIMHLIESGYQPYNILALTFTNKAAKEMKERIAQKIGKEKAAQLWMGTFHSIFMRILRAESDKIGFDKNFTIYDQQDAKNLVKDIIKGMNVDEKTYQPGDVQSRISMAKNNLIEPGGYLSSEFYQLDVNQKKYKVADMYRQYVKKCRTANAMDFDDLLLYTQKLFRDNAEVCQKWANKFKYILVDEYQDTNSVQYNIVKSLANHHHKIFVVGDDAQSIYSFRGAKIENILSFQKDYKESKLFKLEQNYRSTQTIVNAANTVIKHNEKQLEKNSFSENDFGNPIRVLESTADNEEGFLIAKDIMNSVKKENFSYSDFALLYRTNAQSRILEESLRKMNIPYKIYGGLSFYQRKEIKDAIAYFRLLVNLNDDQAFLRVINYPKRGIGDSTIEKIAKIAENIGEQGISIWNTITKIPTMPDNPIPARTLNSIASFMKMIWQLKSVVENEDAYKTASNILSVSTMLSDLTKDTSVEGKTRYENVVELLNGIKDQCQTHLEETGNILKLPEYLENVSLMTGDEKNDEENNKVTLMTIHSSKGLEFKNVYLTGVEEGLFPSANTSQSQKDLEEERRLFYVAITRAQNRLAISFARMRYKWGQLAPATPSRFIKDIDKKYLDFGIGGESQFGLSDIQYAGRFRNLNQENSQFNQRLSQNSASNFSHIRHVGSPSRSGASFKNLKPEEIKIGMLIEHEKFGKGKVVNFEDSKLHIDFINVGRKLLLINYAKLRIVE